MNGKTECCNVVAAQVHDIEFTRLVCPGCKKYVGGYKNSQKMVFHDGSWITSAEHKKLIKNNHHGRKRMGKETLIS